MDFLASPAPVTVTPWWVWGFDKVSSWMGGTDPGAWQPYVASADHEGLLSADGRFLFTGRGEIVEAQAAANVSATGWERIEDGVVVRHTFTPTADPDLATFTVSWTADRPIAGPFWVAVADTLVPVAGLYAVNPRLMAGVDGDQEILTEPNDVLAPRLLEGPPNWFGIGDRYFAAVARPEPGTAGTLSFVPLGSSEGGSRVAVVFSSAETTLEVGQTLTQSFTVYLGPKRVQRLSEIGGGFESVVSLGFFGFFARIVLFTLDLFKGVIPSWGLSIVALTFLVRASLYPLARKAFTSGKAMQAVQPKIKELQEKYADDKEKQSQETMKLFQEHGVNPLGGCLPMLLQIPVFFALIAALDASPDLFGAHFLYLQDLSMQDPYGVLAVLIIAGMYVQQQFMPTTGMDPTQAQMLKFMPIVFGFLMFSYPSGLSVYYVINTFLSILQQWYNTREMVPPSPSPSVPA